MPKNQKMVYPLWQYRLWSFQGRDTKLERFVAKNQLWQMKLPRKLPNLENWSSSGMAIKKCQNSTLKVNFLRQTSSEIRIFLNFFFIEKYKFRGTFLVIDII